MTTLLQVLEKLRLEKKDNEFRWTPKALPQGGVRTTSPKT